MNTSEKALHRFSDPFHTHPQVHDDGGGGDGQNRPSKPLSLVLHKSYKVTPKKETFLIHSLSGDFLFLV